MKQLETFIKKPYPKFKPAKEGKYDTDLGLLKWWHPNQFAKFDERGISDGKIYTPSYFFEPSPMEVKDAEAIEDVIPNPIKDLIREVIMRQGLAFPETEQDLTWSEQKPDQKLMVRLFEYLELGDGIEGDIRNNKGFWNKKNKPA